MGIFGKAVGLGKRGASGYLNAMSKGNAGAWGATLGGGYGAMDSNTSVLGGMAMGGIGGRYGAAALRPAMNYAKRTGLRSAANYEAAGGMAFGGMRRQGKSDWAKLSRMAEASKKYIGDTAPRAWNPIKSTLKKWGDWFGK